MPLTPTSWSGTEFAVNAYTTGTQSRPRIVQLANGNVLICWTDADSGGTANSPAGTDIIGRIFDPLGNPVTGDFRLNFGNADNEMDAEIVALGNGGFMVVYEDNDTNNSILYGTFSASGVYQADGFVVADPDGGAVPNSPVAAVKGDLVLTVWVSDNVDGSESVIGRYYEPSSGTLSSSGSLFSSFGTGPDDDVGGIAITAGQTADSFIVAAVNRNGGADQIVFKKLDGIAPPEYSFTPGFEVSDVQITLLSNGNLALVWQNLTAGTVGLAIYNTSNGIPILAATTITGTPTNEPSIAALADGGFVVVWDATSGIVGQRFDASGNTVGSNFGVDTTGSVNDPNVIALADGRIQVTWYDSGDIRSEIFDVRDVPNATGVYGPNQWVVGTILDDTFTPSGNVEIVHGWDGNDTITEANFGFTQIFGDDGNDRINVTSVIGGDGFSGGNGNDTIDWSAVNETGATFDLAAGTATSAASAVEQMVGFENLNGTQFADIIWGTTGANIINGNGGNDTIQASGGNDILNGGDGDDIFSYSDSASDAQIIGGAGYDTLRATGYAVASFASISGMEALNVNGPGAALVLTAAQFNTGFYNPIAQLGAASVSGTGSLIFNMSPSDLALSLTQLTFTGSGVTVTINGSSGIDAIKGAPGARNRINGGDSTDQIRGGNQADEINGGNGDDKLFGWTGADVLTGGAGADQFRYFFTTDSGTGANADRITDFVIGTDRFNFTLIDADVATAGDQAFSFLGTAAFTNTGVGQIRYANSGADLLVQVDSDGNGLADMEIVLQGLSGQTLTGADFML